MSLHTLKFKSLKEFDALFQKDALNRSKDFYIATKDFHFK